MGIIGWASFLYICVTVLGWIFYLGMKAASKEAEVPEWEKPAGLIHLFDGDRYFPSDPDNAFKHEALDWSTGKLGIIMKEVLDDYPNYHPALAGTIQIAKPDVDAGNVACIIDNEKAAALGLRPAGLTNGAEYTIRNRVGIETLREH